MESRFVEVEGLRVHSLVAGEGPAIVLLPGLLDWAGRWADLGYIDSLANDFSVVAVDPLGVGDSDRTTDPALLGYPSLIAQVVAVLDDLDIEAAYLWGYSAGAQLAAAVAQAHPERVRSLIAGGQVPIFMATNAAQLEAQSQALLERGWDGYWSFTGDPLPAAALAYRAITEPRNDPAVFAARLRGMALPFEAGRTFRGPKLCYVGALEPWLEQAREGMTRLGARFEVIPDADHGGAFRNRDAVEPLVRDFLAPIAI